MNRLAWSILFGCLGLIVKVNGAYGSSTTDLNPCWQLALCKPCGPSLSSSETWGDQALGQHPCPKTALSGLPHAASLLTPTLTVSQRQGLALSAAGERQKSDQLRAIRPRTGGQLYGQRLATLQAGQLYSLTPPGNYADQWQTAWRQPTYQQWQSLLSQEARMMAARQGNSSVTVLVGDSLYLWLPPEHLPNDRLWLNQSISGETTGHVLRRLTYFATVRPEVIYVMTGVNDLKTGVEPSVIVSNMELMVQRLRVQHPQARIVVLSILPTRWPPISATTVRRVNQRISTVVRRRGGEFVDLQSVFMDPQGLLRADLTTDGIHLSPQGYSLLATYLTRP
jgi:lysophospholipase L1-like esterase